MNKINKIKLDFTSVLDKDLAKSHVNYTVEVYNKNGTFNQSYGFSTSFDIDEIYQYIKTRHPNKTYKLIIEIK